MMVHANEYIYQEYDEVDNMYFLKSGECGYVIAKYRNSKYIDIPTAYHFGVIDIIGSVLKLNNGILKLKEWNHYRKSLRR